MPYFSLMTFQHWALGLFLGLGLVLLLYIGWGSIPGRNEDAEVPPGMEHEEHDEKNPVAPLLVFVFVGALAWAILYMVAIGIKGGSF